MSILVVGLNHRSADLALLERLAVPAEQTAKALRSLVQLDHVSEAVVLSTCNRVEVYAHVTRFHPGMQEIRGWLAERGDIHPQDLDAVHYAYYDDRAAAHLFAVAAGLDSMVVGEQQIALQVKQSMEVARAEGTARRMLQRLFRQAVRVGRRVRRETAIGTGASSMVDIGLAAAAERVGGALDDRDVTIVGAGKIGGIAADRLRDVAGDVRVWNRSDDKADRLARRVGGEAVRDGGLAAAIAASDLVVCTTGAPEPLLDVDLIRTAVAGRDGRPLVLLDLAMPRNVEPAVADLPDVTVVDIASVREAADRSVTGEEMAAARDIVDDEAARFLAWLNTIEVEPTIRALRGRAEEVRRTELDRLGTRLNGLDDRQRETVEALTRGIINTLLHEPTVRLKYLADSGSAEHHANALRELFDLDEQ
jgi:glutamyl-tRNA reductase